MPANETIYASVVAFITEAANSDIVRHRRRCEFGR
jgi:hypothetical protein